jgi:DUF1365 family protein
MSEPAIRLWFGRTVHRREAPFVRSFSHAIAMIDVDIDRLAEANASSKLFSVNANNAIAFRETDRGARRADVPLRLWAEAQFAEAGVFLDGGQIRLISFPRVLGHGFAPISIWLGHGPDGALRGAIYEVHNTFGETHAYVSACTRAQHVADKEFFVSPFFDVSGQYRFILRPSAERLELIVENLGSDGRNHVASLMARPRPISDPAILKWLIQLPLSGLGVVFAIHWQALILWVRGARYHIRPAQRPSQTTIAQAADEAAAAGPRKRA